MKKNKFLLSFVLILMSAAVKPHSVSASLSQGLGATQVSQDVYDFADCEKQHTGYREGLIADRIELKLANTPNLSPDERKQWLSDIAKLRQVKQTHTPDPTNDQHYLFGLTHQEQQAINSMNSRHYNETRLNCEHKYGGLTRYSSGSDTSLQTNYEDSLKAGLGQAQNIDAIPAEALTSGKPKSRAQIHAEEREKEKAQRQQGAQNVNECMQQMKGLRPRLVAQALQRKLESGSVSGKERGEIEQDLKDALSAAEKGLDQIPSPDPNNPNGAQRHLDLQEQMAITNEYLQQTMQLTMNCNQNPMGQPAAPAHPRN